MSRTYPCCYCSKIKRKEEMSTIPMSIKRQTEWIKALGAKYAENCVKATHRAICKSHFELDEEGNRKRYGTPKPLPFCSIPEDGEEENYEDSEPSTSSTQTLDLKKIDIQKTMKVTRARETCCYCFAKHKREFMSRVPTRKELREEWIEVLGEEFGKNALYYRNPMICLTHFETIRKKKRVRYALPIPLPFGVEKQREEKNEEENEKSKIVKKQNKICVYCAKILPSTMMTQVPNNPAVLEQWGYILGDEFLHNNSLFKAGKICLSHFELTPTGKKPINALPIPIPGGIRQKYKRKEIIIQKDADL